MGILRIYQTAKHGVVNLNCHLPIGVGIQREESALIRSSSFTVPTGVSAIKSLSIALACDGAGEEFCGLLKISGNAMRDGDAVFATGGQMTMGTSTGSNMNFVQYDTDLAVQSGNSVELSIATTTNATIDVVVTAQFA